METKDRIRQLRVSEGLSQIEFAAKLETKKSNVGQWELGNNYPSIDILIKMSRIYGCSVDWILTGNDQRPSIIDRQVQEYLADLDAIVHKLKLLIGADQPLPAEESSKDDLTKAVQTIESGSMLAKGRTSSRGAKSTQNKSDD